jgi:uncharacterized protein (DUF302 family)
VPPVIDRLQKTKGPAMTSPSDSGIVHLRSPYSVPETSQRLEAIIAAKGLMLFARIDHSGEAAKAGMQMAPTELFLFGSPTSGTPLMIAAPTLAIDLPLKALIWQDAEGVVWLSYDTPEYLQQRHKFPEVLLQNIAGIRSICEQVVRQP